MANEMRFSVKSGADFRAALNDFKGAIKDVRDELKEVDKEIKKVAKEGGDLTRLQERRGNLSGTVESLKYREAQRKLAEDAAEKSVSRRLAKILGVNTSTPASAQMLLNGGEGAARAIRRLSEAIEKRSPGVAGALNRAALGTASGVNTLRDFLSSNGALMALSAAAAAAAVGTAREVSRRQVIAAATNLSRVSEIETLVQSDKYGSRFSSEFLQSMTKQSGEVFQKNADAMSNANIKETVSSILGKSSDALSFASKAESADRMRKLLSRRYGSKFAESTSDQALTGSLDYDRLLRRNVQARMREYGWVGEGLLKINNLATGGGTMKAIENETRLQLLESRMATYEANLRTNDPRNPENPNHAAWRGQQLENAARIEALHNKEYLQSLDWNKG